MLISPVFSLAPITNSREGQSLCSSLKKWQIYEGLNSATFFYSEIEHVWLLLVNSGVITVNGSTLKEEYTILENTAKIGIGKKIFIFNNLSTVCSLSKILSNTLLKHKNLSIKTENILKMIQCCVTEYKDSFFVFDVLRKNPIFSYRYGEFILNADVLYNDILLDTSSFKEPVKFEFDNSFNKKERLNLINATSLHQNPNFHTFNKESCHKPVRFPWPLSESLEKYVCRSVDESVSFSYLKPVYLNTKNRRYINNYVVGTKGDIIDSDKLVRKDKGSSPNENNSQNESSNHEECNSQDGSNDLNRCSSQNESNSQERCSSQNESNCLNKCGSQNDCSGYSNCGSQNDCSGYSNCSSQGNCSIQGKCSDCCSSQSECCSHNECIRQNEESTHSSHSITKLTDSLDISIETSIDENTSESNSSTTVLANITDYPNSSSETICSSDGSTQTIESTQTGNSSRHLKYSTSQSCLANQSVSSEYSNPSMTFLPKRNKNEPTKRRSPGVDEKRSKYKFHLDFSTVVEELFFPGDSEISIEPFRSDAEIQRMKKTEVNYKTRSFVEHELLNRRKCYEKYFPIRKLEKTPEGGNFKGISR